MNTNGHIPTMYESTPAVSALNRVPGFEPLKLLRRVVSPEDGKEILQLDLRYKKLWFRLANPKGRIRLNPLSITEQMAVFEAQVFLDRSDQNPVGSFTSGCRKEEAPDGRYIQAAQFEAMDEALTDAGFGVQFADVSMDKDGSRYGSRIALTDKMPTGQENMAAPSIKNLQNAGLAQGTNQTGSMMKTYPGEGSSSAAKASSSMAAMQGQSNKAVVQRRKADETMQKGQPEAAKALAVPAGAAFPASNNPSGKAASDGKGAERKEIPSVTVQEGKSTAGNRANQNSLPVQLSVVKVAETHQTVAVPGQKGQTVGSARAFHPVLAQRQVAQPSVNGIATRLPGEQSQPHNQSAGKTASVQPVGSSLPVQPQNIKGHPVQNNAINTVTSGTNMAGAGALPIQPGTVGAAVKTMEKLPADMSESDTLPVQSGTIVKAAEKLPVNAAESNSLPVQPETEETTAKTMEKLPVSAAETNTLPIQHGTVETTIKAAGTLPVNAVKSEPLSVQSAVAESAAAAEETLPSTEKDRGMGQLQNSVQGAMALLAGQKLPASSEASSTGKVVPMEPNPVDRSPAISGNPAQEAAAPRYTADMSVEEIVKLMTLEEAGKVVVGEGVCKGMTIAEVAERRTPSLKFYRYGGYRGNDNILRAAAQIMLDSMETEKAS